MCSPTFVISPVTCICGHQDGRDSDFISMQRLKDLAKTVSWCLQPSQPQRITSGLNTNPTISKLFILQVIIPQFMFFEPIYIPRALNTGTCIQQGDPFYSSGLHRNRCWPQTIRGKFARSFGRNAREWTGWVEISKEEIPSSRVAGMAIY